MSAQDQTSQTLREQIEQLIAKWREQSASEGKRAGALLREYGSDSVASELWGISTAHANAADELSGLLPAVQQAADRLASLEQEQQELRRLLTCQRNDGTHYCPNCDQSLFVATGAEEQQERERTSRVLPDAKPVPDARVERLGADAPQSPTLTISGMGNIANVIVALQAAGYRVEPMNAEEVKEPL